MESDRREDSTISVKAKRESVKFQVYGKEMVEKTVRESGNSGRVYLPAMWVGACVKIIRID